MEFALDGRYDFLQVCVFTASQGLLLELKRFFSIEIAPLSVDPQLIGALGAAIIASRKKSISNV